MYINFFPGKMNEAPEISVTEHAAYGIGDIEDLVISVINGRTCSAPLEGAKDALEDGSVWGDLCAECCAVDVQNALEEIHDAIA